ncbi:MAG TPA: hypothetical protein PKJ85_08570, partial [Nitrosomonas nitrosa]|nr:hypothetical protein [Nitrosomonas nitrosa]
MDSFASREAERLLKEWKVQSFPVEPLDIAQQHDIACKAMPSKNGGVSGMFIKNRGNYLPLRNIKKHLTGLWG